MTLITMRRADNSLVMVPKVKVVFYILEFNCTIENFGHAIKHRRWNYGTNKIS